MKIKKVIKVYLAQKKNMKVKKKNQNNKNKNHKKVLFKKLNIWIMIFPIFQTNNLFKGMCPVSQTMKMLNKIIQI